MNDSATLLHIACKNCHTKIVEALFGSGADGSSLEFDETLSKDMKQLIKKITNSNTDSEKPTTIPNKPTIIDRIVWHSTKMARGVSAFRRALWSSIFLGNNNNNQR